MAWSTRQLSDLTGVTLRSIRHWHQLGLLPEPERLTNGYKQYTPTHLVLALRITRLTGLGFSLAQVAAMLDSDDVSRHSLREMRAEVDNRIGMLQRLRSQLDDLVESGASPDLSPEALLALDVLGADMGSRNIAILLARLLPKEGMATFAQAMRAAPDAITHFNDELLLLPADASQESIDTLTEHGTALIGGFVADLGDVLPRLDFEVGKDAGAEAMTTLMNEHMNPAQQQVMARITASLSSSR